MPQILDTSELREWLEARRPLTVLDVRPSAQREDWYIPGSLHVDLASRRKSGDERVFESLDLPKDQPVVTVCARGRSSQAAADELSRLGYQTYSLRGGMMSWGAQWNLASLLLETGVELIQVRRVGKGCLSYLLVSAGEAVVIDASVDPQVYLDLAASKGAKLTAVVDTHVHADHLTRSRLLAGAAGVPVYLPPQQRVNYPYQAMGDGNEIEFGESRLRALVTPGHTWESTSYYLPDTALFTGDTLFVDGVGRPDLEAGPGEATRRAGALHASLQRLLELPENVLVLPGHSSEPPGFDQELVGLPLGEVRGRVELLQLGHDEFVRRITEQLPPTPENHHAIVAMNEAGEFPDDPEEVEAGGNRCAVA